MPANRPLGLLCAQEPGEDACVAEVRALGVDPRWTVQLSKYDSERVSAKLEMTGRPPLVKGEPPVPGVAGWKL
jgi:hypothetical protein